MSEIVEAALALWGHEGAAYRLIAARENTVYRVERAGAPFALRVHRSGYRTDDELRSELAWMAAASRGGLRVPAPIASNAGALLAHTHGRRVDALSWLPGRMLAEVLPDLRSPARAALFTDLGVQMARLHNISDAWTPPAGFACARWDLDGLLGDAPLWDRFWDNPALTEAQRMRALTFREAARARLAAEEPALDFGLIHADLVPANVLVDGAELALIDFNDGGFGYRLFDVATALLKHRGAPDYADLERGLIAGYRSVRELNVGALDLFIALRAATYVGWNISRMDEEGGPARNARFIAAFCREAEAFLAANR